MTKLTHSHSSYSVVVVVVAPEAVLHLIARGVAHQNSNSQTEAPDYYNRKCIGISIVSYIQSGII